MPSCSAFGCTHRSTQGYLMKVFPRNPLRRALWAAKVKRKNWVPNDHSYLCEKHFDESQWKPIMANGKRKLKDTAVPTIFCFTPKKHKSDDYMPCENISFQSVDIDESADLSSDNEPLITKCNSNYRKGMDKSKDVTLKIEENNHTNDNLQNSKVEMSCDSRLKPKTEYNDNCDVYSDMSSDSESCQYTKNLDTNKLFHKDIFESMKNYNSTDKIKALEKHIWNLEKELKIANEGISRRDERISNFKKKLRKARIERKRIQSTDYEKILRSVFNDDQIEALYRKSTNYKKWCNDTVEKAMKYKNICGVEGYNLIKDAIPLPSVRTLQRRLEKIRDFPDNKDDISSLSSDNRDDEPFFRDYK